MIPGYVRSRLRDHYQVAQSRLLAARITEIPAAFGEVEKFRTKGKIRNLPESLVTMGDVREVVRYLSLRARIELVARHEVDIRVPVCLVAEVEDELRTRRIFATVITVRPLGFWDHLLLWRTVLSSRIEIK